MIYLAESGSTKCDALFIDDAGQPIRQISTMGFNPYFHSAAFIEAELSQHPDIVPHRREVDQVYFYGAGCSTPALNAIVQQGLEAVFPHAEVHVDHDLVAAAYSTYNNEPAITCILGTGSNSVYFDGENIREEVPALAFILGDEGSASYLGKQVVSNYLYKRLPEAAQKDFWETYQLSKDDIIDRVYNKPNANVFLANFAPFVSKHIESPFFQELVHEGFRQFLEVHVQCYPEAAYTPLHFVGSIAYHFSDILMSEVAHAQLKMGNLVQKPLDGLVAYHQHYIWSSRATS